MTPTELAEVYRPRVERVAHTYRSRGVVVLPSQVDQAVALAVAWATSAQEHGAELVDLDGCADLAGQALDTVWGADRRRQYSADLATTRG